MCVVVVDSVLTVPVLQRVTRSVGGFTARTVSAPEALVLLVGAGIEITERANSTFFCTPSGAATAVVNFSLCRGVVQQDGAEARSNCKE